MSKLIIALSLYLGLGCFFALNAIALLSGASVTAALSRGLSGLAVFVALGGLAGLVLRARVPSPDKTED